MTQKQPANYTLMNILNSNLFFRTLINAVNISRDTCHESSFGVYGDMQKYRITRALKEDQHRTLCGTDGRGIVYDQEGYGLYVPENKSRIIAVHFHNPESAAIPSKDDLKTELQRTNLAVYSKDKWFVFNKTEVIGHSPEKEEITLLFRQLVKNPDEITVSDEEFATYTHDLQRSKLGDEKGTLDFSDRELSHKVAELLNSTGFYRAVAVSFGDKNSYRKEIKKLREFTLLEQT